MRRLSTTLLFIFLIVAITTLQITSAEDDSVKVTGYVLRSGKGATFEMPYVISIDWFGTVATEVKDSQLKLGDIYIYVGDILETKFFPWEWKGGIVIKVSGEEVYRDENSELKYTYTVKVIYLDGLLEVYVDDTKVYTKTVSGPLSIAMDDDARLVNVFNVGSDENGQDQDNNIVTDEPGIEEAMPQIQNLWMPILAGFGIFSVLMIVLTRVIR